MLIIVGVSVHECSHLWAADKLGFKLKGFELYPFGGIASADGKFKSYDDQVFLVLMGPVGGGMLAIATVILYHLVPNQFIGAAGVWLCMLNVFDLLPLSFMDGGQLLDTITYSVNKYVGLSLKIVSTLIVFIILFKFNTIIALVILLYGLDIYIEYRSYAREKHKLILNLPEINVFINKYYQVISERYIDLPKSLTTKQVIFTIGTWILTTTMLIVAMYSVSNHPLDTLSIIFHNR
jgi:Zn-dependent protease